MQFKKTAFLSISYLHHTDFLAILSWLRNFRQAKVLTPHLLQTPTRALHPQVCLIKARAFLAGVKPLGVRLQAHNWWVSLSTYELDSPGLLENSRDWSFTRWLSGKDTWRTAMIRK